VGVLFDGRAIYTAGLLVH